MSVAAELLSTPLKLALRPRCSLSGVESQIRHIEALLKTRLRGPGSLRPRLDESTPCMIGHGMCHGYSPSGRSRENRSCIT